MFSDFIVSTKLQIDDIEMQVHIVITLYDKLIFSFKAQTFILLITESGCKAKDKVTTVMSKGTQAYCLPTPTEESKIAYLNPKSRLI